jgi:hypothetical protein
MWEPRRPVTGIALLNLTAICELIVQKMWEPRRLTTLWASTACYRDSFSFIFFLLFKLPKQCIIDPGSWSSWTLAALSWRTVFAQHRYDFIVLHLQVVYAMPNCTDWGKNEITVYVRPAINWHLLAPSVRRDSSVGVATRLRVRWLGNRGSIPGRDRDFSCLHNVQTGSGAHPASYSMSTRGFFPGVKATGAWN